MHAVFERYKTLFLGLCCVPEMFVNNRYSTAKRTSIALSPAWLISLMREGLTCNMACKLCTSLAISATIHSSSQGKTFRTVMETESWLECSYSKCKSIALRSSHLGNKY